MSRPPASLTPEELLRRATAAYRQVTVVRGDGDALRQRIVSTLKRRERARRRFFMATAPLALLVVAACVLLCSGRLRGVARALYGSWWSTVHAH